MIVTGTSVFLIETVFQQKAKYGRYNTANTGVSASLAWFLQETPSFLVPLAFLIFGEYKVVDPRTNSINLNLILLSFFMLHYFHRYILTIIIKNFFIDDQYPISFKIIYLFNAHNEQKEGRLS
jgi:hypothetical protein